MTQTFVYRNKGIKLINHRIQQWPIVKIAPSQLWCSAHLVHGDFMREFSRHTTVEKYSHAGTQAITRQQLLLIVLFWQAPVRQ